MIYLPIETSGRRRDQRPQPRADGARRGQEQGQDASSPSAWSATGLTLDECRAYVEAHPEIEAAHVPGAAHQGRGRARPPISSLHIADRMKREGARGQLSMDRHFLHRHGRRLHHGEGRGRRRRHRRDPLARLPAPRHQAAGEGARVPEALRGRDRRLLAPTRTPHLHHRLGRQRHRPSTSAPSSCRKSTPSRSPSRSCYPECGSVIELGGQDAKIIIFKEDPETGRKKKIPSMNDKCAGGTGAVIDKINAKLRIPAERALQHGLRGHQAAPVAGKCGVFAETDINGLQKMGVPPDELMASLFEAIVMQNLSVLTRGNTLRRWSCCSAAPTATSRACATAGSTTSRKIWEERNIAAAGGRAARRPDPDARERPVLRRHRRGRVRQDRGRRASASTAAARSSSGTSTSGRERGEGQGAAAAAWPRTTTSWPPSRSSTAASKFIPATFQPGEVVRGLHRDRRRLDLHQGRAALERQERRVLAKAYQLSKGNPIEDTIESSRSCDEQITRPGRRR